MADAIQSSMASAATNPAATNASGSKFHQDLKDLGKGAGAAGYIAADVLSGGRLGQVSDNS